MLSVFLLEQEVEFLCLLEFVTEGEDGFGGWCGGRKGNRDILHRKLFVRMKPEIFLKTLQEKTL